MLPAVSQHTEPDIKPSTCLCSQLAALQEDSRLPQLCLQAALFTNAQTQVQCVDLQIIFVCCGGDAAASSSTRGPWRAVSPVVCRRLV